MEEGPSKGWRQEIQAGGQTQSPLVRAPHGLVHASLTKCRLGLYCVQQTPTAANSASIAAAAAAIANPQFQALLATIGAFQGGDE